jgi:hypothetical protein
MIAGTGGNIRVGAAEKPLQSGLTGIAEMAEAEDVFDRLQHRIVIEGKVRHRSGLQDARDQHSANAVATEALGDLEEGRGVGVGGLKSKRERLTSCDERADIGSRVADRSSLRLAR